MLTLAVKVGDSVLIGGPVKLTVADREGQAVSLKFDADRSIPIYRLDADGKLPAELTTGITGQPEKGTKT